MSWGKIRFNDSVGGGKSETDAIRAINKRKGFVSGNDVLQKEEGTQKKEEETPQAPSRVSGSDSTNNPDSDTPNQAALNASDLEDGQMLITRTDLSRLVQAAVSKEMAGHQVELKRAKDQLKDTQQELDRSREAAEAERKRLEQEITAQKKQRDILAGVFEEFGYAPPSEDAATHSYISPAATRGGISGRDAARELKRIFEDKYATPSNLVVSPSTGEAFVHQDTRAMMRFMRQHRAALRDGMEALFRKEGFLKGQSSSFNFSDAPTTFQNLSPFFQIYLSTVIRLEHAARFILWQFANRKVANGVPPGQTVLVPRVLHLETGTTSTDWELTPGLRTTTDRQPLQALGQPIVIRENGMGKDIKIRPVSIPEIIMANSLLELETILQQRLGYNYNEFEDFAILEMWLSTSAVVYNNNGDVVATSGEVAQNGKGQLTVDFLGSLYAHMATQKIPTYEDGCYGYAAPPSHIAQLNKDLRQHQFVYEKSSVEDLMSMLFISTQNEAMGDRVTGYVGKIAGFHIFSGNSFSIGAPGTPGVQAERFGAGQRVTRSGFGFGPDTVGWATAMPMQIREDNNNDFQRSRDFIWKSHEGWGPLDVDPNSNPPVSLGQQLRVIETRMSQTPA